MTRAESATPAAAPKIPVLEFFWLLLVFPALLFLSIAIMTQSHTGHKFRMSVHYVWIGLQHAEVWPWIQIGLVCAAFGSCLQLLISEPAMRTYNFALVSALLPFMTLASGLIAFECHLRDLTHEETYAICGAANVIAFVTLPVVTSWSKLTRWWQNRNAKLD